ncbi:MAG TPA: M28 family peptidase [Gemmatimonadales bacterium]|nr:M28 family peptidase [Gemmatimonadales bacterium]
MGGWPGGRIDRVTATNVRCLAIALAVHLSICPPAPPLAAQDVVPRLAGALLGDTPMVEDLRVLTDQIGGRPAGSAANRRAIDWALERFKAAGVPATKEVFRMPGLWLERSATAVVRGGVEFAPRIAAMPYSTGTRAGFEAALVDGRFGRAEDYRALGSAARGALVLIEMPELRDLDGLFREYSESVGIEHRAFEAGAAGVIYQGSRPGDNLYRHNASLAYDNRHPVLAMERDGAARALRLLRSGMKLTIAPVVSVESGPAYDSWNVIGEIRGTSQPDEVVIVGAHLDSWDLGTGALDNGANVAMLIDVARQMKRLGLRPARTVRFALWNGEELGLFGSFGYTQSHKAELPRHVVAASFDIGTGRITGFFTNGRAELIPVLDRGLMPVAGLGPFSHLNIPVVGTDNFDFMLQGVPNLIANQESANYGPNYHARSDEFDKVDLHQLRLNAAIAAAVTWEFANAPSARIPHQTPAQVDSLIAATDLEQQMRSYGNIWDAWVKGERGRPAR